MKKVVPFLCAASFLGAHSARADVSWEHSGRIAVGTTPLATFNLKNEWSGQKHRARFFFDATGLALFGAPADKAKGTLNLIERLDDDKIVIAPEMVGVPAQYVEEPYSTLKSRLQINFWEGLDDRLASEPIPSLTPEQRRRLGREIRAAVSPLARRFSRQYFRVLPQKRTIMGLESTGYRYSSLLIIPEKGRPSQNIRTTVEFWLAAPQDSDAEIQGFTTAANNLKKGPPSSSMWLNEYFPIIFETMPDELQQTIESLVGDKDAPNFGYRGTPTQFFVTVTLPVEAQMMGGDIRFIAELKKRSTEPVDASVFQTPTVGKRVEIEPFLKLMKNGVKQARTQMEVELDKLIR